MLQNLKTKVYKDNLKAMALLLALLIATRMIGSLPWWVFVIPVLVLGMILTLRQWQVASFLVGFASGFIIWLGANLYFDAVLDGSIFPRLGALIAVPPVIVLLISALIGGVLTGLAFYTGKQIVYKPANDLMDYQQ